MTKKSAFQCPPATNNQCPVVTPIYIMPGCEQADLFKNNRIIQKPNMHLPYRLRIKETREYKKQIKKQIAHVSKIARTNKNIVLLNDCKREL